MTARLVAWTAPGSRVTTDLFETVVRAARRTPRRPRGSGFDRRRSRRPSSPPGAATRRAHAPVVVDVREPWELERCRIEGSTLDPDARAARHASAELPDDRELVLVCHHGGRSAQAAQWLARNGFARVHNLAGGVDAWARMVDPAMPRY